MTSDEQVEWIVQKRLEMAEREVFREQQRNHYETISQTMSTCMQILATWNVATAWLLAATARKGEEFRPLSKVKAGVPIEGAARAEVPLNAGKLPAKGHQ